MENKKEKVINVGITEELINFIKEQTTIQREEKEDKPGREVKEQICKLVSKEVDKIEIELRGETDYGKKLDLIGLLDKLADIVRYW